MGKHHAVRVFLHDFTLYSDKTVGQQMTKGHSMSCSQFLHVRHMVPQTVHASLVFHNEPRGSSPSSY